MCLPNEESVFKVEREWESHGLKCVVVQARENQNRCGYVRVPTGHPLHGKHYDDADVNVHGGLTFAEIEPCAHEDGTGWWFGFDCDHAGDSMYEPGKHPAYLNDFYGPRGRYFMGEKEHFWLEEEVAKETERLAAQLAKLS